MGNPDRARQLAALRRKVIANPACTLVNINLSKGYDHDDHL